MKLKPIVGFKKSLELDNNIRCVIDSPYVVIYQNLVKMKLVLSNWDIIEKQIKQKISSMIK